MKKCLIIQKNKFYEPSHLIFFSLESLDLCLNYFVYGDSGSPFGPFLSDMPIISKRIGNIISTRWHTRVTNGIAIVVERLDFAFANMIPEMHGSISTTGRKPFIGNRMKCQRIDWIKNHWIALLISIACFMGLECDVTFLKLNIKLPNYIPCWNWTKSWKCWLFHRSFQALGTSHSCSPESSESESIFPTLKNHCLFFFEGPWCWQALFSTHSFQSPKPHLHKQS